MLGHGAAAEVNDLVTTRCGCGDVRDPATPAAPPGLRDDLKDSGGGDDEPLAAVCLGRPTAAAAQVLVVSGGSSRSISIRGLAIQRRD